MQPIPIIATGTGGLGANEFKTLPFRASRKIAPWISATRILGLG